jgi:hypothetical protein
MNAVTKPQERNPATDMSLALLFESLEDRHASVSWGTGPWRREVEYDLRDYVATRYREGGHCTEQRFENLGDALDWLKKP